MEAIAGWKVWLVIAGALMALNYVIPLGSSRFSGVGTIFTWSLFSNGFEQNVPVAVGLLLISLIGLTICTLAFAMNGLALAISIAAAGFLGLVMTIVGVANVPMMPHSGFVPVMILALLMCIAASATIAWDGVRRRVRTDGVARFATLGSSIGAIVVTIALVIATMNTEPSLTEHGASGGQVTMAVFLLLSALLPIAGLIVHLVQAAMSHQRPQSGVGRHLVLWGIATVGVLAACLVWVMANSLDRDAGFWLGQTALRTFGIMAASGLFLAYGVVGILLMTVYEEAIGGDAGFDRARRRP